MTRLPVIRDARSAAVIWIALVAIGVLGRLYQPAWNVTPLAGVGLAAGAVFANPLVAASVPLSALAVGNLVLPGYGGFTMAVVVWLATAWPVLLGPAVRSGRLLPLVGGGLAHSLVFFLVTNAAHFVLTDDYPHTVSGMVSCFAAALPFYRWMPIGDVCWAVIVVSALSAALHVFGITYSRSAGSGGS